MTAVVANRQRRVPVNVAALRRAAMVAMRMEAAPEDAEVSIAVTDDAEIRDLNRRYLGKNQPTDVLAFPLGAAEGIRRGRGPHGGRRRVVARRIGGALRRPAAMQISGRLLGEVVVSAERAVAQAAEYGHSVHKEMELLVVHGVLHLLGYDDKRPQAKRVMEERQAMILQAWRPATTSRQANRGRPATTSRQANRGRPATSSRHARQQARRS